MYRLFSYGVWSFGWFADIGKDIGVYLEMFGAPEVKWPSRNEGGIVSSITCFQANVILYYLYRYASL